ncbi:hypothetical protein LLH23_20320 [bacterium]|nr:hypothetical protein [bacterium]
MRLILRKPIHLSCDSAATWAWYGATQALGMLGVTYDERAPEGGLEQPYIIIDPARGQLCLNCEPDGEPADLPTADIARVTHEACLAGPTVEEAQVLPLMGLPRAAGAGVAVGEIRRLDGAAPPAPFLTVAQEGDASRIHLAGRVFETIGLYLSRFSWAGDPGWQRFVREVDDLWDLQLRERWGGQAVVDDYVQITAGLLCQLCAEAGEPLVTVWPHPFRDGQVKRQGFLVSHDVDQLFADQALRTQLDQSANPRFFPPRWRQFESDLNIRSAFYLFCAKPGEKYWLEPNYSIADPAVLREAQAFLEGGWEVSLHQISHETAAEVRGEVEFLLEILGLDRPTGTRSHHLKHTFDTLAHKAAAGLRYDSTWYAEQATSGLLCGTLLPFRPLDCRTLEPVGLWEFPFVIEDGIVFGVYGEGTGRDVAGAIANGKPLLDLAVAHDGFVCFNWHQRTFSQMSSYPGVADCWPPAMAGLIRALRDQSPATWNPLPVELADWCSRREGVRVTAAEGKVTVHNTGNCDCDDVVLCLHLPRGQGCPLEAIGRDVPAGAEFLGHQGSRCLYAVPLVVCAGQTAELIIQGRAPSVG